MKYPIRGSAKDSKWIQYHKKRKEFVKAHPPTPDDKVFHLCARITDQPFARPESIVDHCSKCGEDVWVFPYSDPPAPAWAVKICNRCFMKWYAAHPKEELEVLNP